MKAPLQPAKSFGSAASPTTAQRKSGLKTIVNNRPSAIAQRKMQGVVQREMIANQNLMGGIVAQRVAVITEARARQANSSVSARLLIETIAELQTIVSAADDNQGAASDTDVTAIGISPSEVRSRAEFNRLTELLADANVKATLPTDNRNTFGLGGANYVGTSLTTVQGDANFIEAISSVANGAETLGARVSKTHDEVHQIINRPGLQALLSTQGHCLFCYGLIHSRGYVHGAMRDNPWPQNWRHDYKGFVLNKSSAALDTISNNPILRIDTDNYGTRYYEVSTG
jgi:hypothetical protein